MLGVCGRGAGREAGVASAAHGGTKSVQSTEGDLLGPTGPHV